MDLADLCDERLLFRASSSSSPVSPRMSSPVSLRYRASDVLLRSILRREEIRVGDADTPARDPRDDDPPCPLRFDLLALPAGLLLLVCLRDDRRFSFPLWEPPRDPPRDPVDGNPPRAPSVEVTDLCK